MDEQPSSNGSKGSRRGSAIMRTLPRRASGSYLVTTPHRPMTPLTTRATSFMEGMTMPPSGQPVLKEPRQRSNSTVGTLQNKFEMQVSPGCRKMLKQMTKRRQSTMEGAEGSVESSDEGSRFDDDFLIERKDREHGFIFDIVRWVYADRDIAQDIAQRPTTQLDPPDILRLRTRCDAAAIFAAGAVLLNIVGGVWYLAFGFYGCGALLCANAGCIFLGMASVRRIAAADGNVVRAVNAFAVFLIAATLGVPFILYASLPLTPHSSDVAIWTLMAPVAAVFLIPSRQLEVSRAIHLARTFAVTLLLSLDAMPPSDEQAEVPVVLLRRVCGVGVLVCTHVVCPVCIALALRMAMDEFQWWRESLSDFSEQQTSIDLGMAGDADDAGEQELREGRNTQLINSVVPRGKEDMVRIALEARRSTTSSEADGAMQTVMELDRAVETYDDCSVVQMDIKGFTSLSSKMSAEDLVDLINTIFTSIDESADVIGNVWKVETIGDCYKAVVGGIFPCERHVEHAVCLATVILEIVQGISRRLYLDPPLTVRCGVHTGQVTAAIVGTLLPRYLIYGPTCDMVNQLEASADAGCVQCSQETAERLPVQWRRTTREMELARGQGVVQTACLELQEEARWAMLNEKQRIALKSVLSIFAKPKEPALPRTPRTPGRKKFDGPALDVERLQSGVSGPDTRASPEERLGLEDMISSVAAGGLISGSLCVGNTEQGGRHNGGSSTDSTSVGGTAGYSASGSTGESTGLSQGGSREWDAAGVSALASLTPARAGAAGGLGARTLLDPPSAGSTGLESEGGGLVSVRRGLIAPPGQDEMEEAGGERGQGEGGAEGEAAGARGRRGRRGERSEGEGTGSGPGGSIRELLDGLNMEYQKTVAASPTSIRRNTSLFAPRVPASPENSKASESPTHLRAMHAAASGIFAGSALWSGTFIQPSENGRGVYSLPAPNRRASLSTPRRGSPPILSSPVASRQPANAPLRRDRTNPFLLPASPAHRPAGSRMSSTPSPPRSRRSPANRSPPPPSANAASARYFSSPPLSFLASVPNLPVTPINKFARQGSIGGSLGGSRGSLSRGDAAGPSSGGGRASPPGIMTTMPTVHSEEASFETMGTATYTESMEAGLLEEQFRHLEEEEGSEAEAEAGRTARELVRAGERREEDSRMEGKLLTALLAVSALGAALHLGVLLLAASRGEGKGEGTALAAYAVVPGVFGALVGGLWRMGGGDAEVLNGGWGRWAVKGLLLLSPVAMMGGWDGRVLESSVLWAPFAMLLQAGRVSDGGDRGFLLLVGAYAAVVVVVHASGFIDGFGNAHEVEAEEWWVVALRLVNELVPTTLYFLPLALSADALFDKFSASKDQLRGLLQALLEQKRLLSVLVPPIVWQRLLDGEDFFADKVPSATVMFVYMADFDEIMDKFGPALAIGWVNEVFAQLDSCVTGWKEERNIHGQRKRSVAEIAHEVTKVETYNNFFMAVCFGGAEKWGPSAFMAARVAHSMVRAATRVQRPDGTKTVVKVGLNTGPLCAGVIGQTAPRFSIFGDTVNTASRMASTSEPAAEQQVYIHMSEDTARELQQGNLGDMKFLEGLGLRFEKRGEGMEVKGKGFMQTYCLRERCDADDPLPGEGAAGPFPPQGAGVAAEESVSRVGTYFE